MLLNKVTVKAGAEKPFGLLHVTDNHLALADSRDDERKLELAASRKKSFDAGDDGRCERYLDEAIEYAKGSGKLLVHTGDIIDFVSYLNLETVKRKLSGVDCMVAAGNHEFSLYVGEEFEDAAYRARSYDQVQAVFGNDITFSSRMVNGVNLVFADDSYYLFSADQLEQFRREFEKGYPVILFLHNPLFTRELYEEKKAKNICAYVTGCPEELMGYYDDYRLRQQRPDAATLETVAYLKSRPELKAIFAGHLHYPRAGLLDNGVPQYVTGGGYAGHACEITVE